MTYLFNTPDQRATCCERSAPVSSMSCSSKSLPPSGYRPLNLAPAAGEMELDGELRGLASRNSGCGSRASSWGAASTITLFQRLWTRSAARGEFYTAYTPYQAEASQGSLQAFFEYPVAHLRPHGDGVCNASLYEGGTAVSEAAFMAIRVTDRHQKIVVSGPFIRIPPSFAILSLQSEVRAGRRSHAGRDGRPGEGQSRRGRPDRVPRLSASEFFRLPRRAGGTERAVAPVGALTVFYLTRSVWDFAEAGR